MVAGATIGDEDWGRARTKLKEVRGKVFEILWVSHLVDYGGDCVTFFSPERDADVDGLGRGLA